MEREKNWNDISGNNWHEMKEKRKKERDRMKERERENVFMEANFGLEESCWCVHIGNTNEMVGLNW